MPLTMVVTIVSAVVAGVLCYGLGSLGLRFIDLPFKGEWVIPALAGVCGAFGGGFGAGLVSPHFNRVCSMRNMIECACGFAAAAALHLANDKTIGLVFTWCLIIYLFCLLVLMNQECLIKPSYYFSSCHATNKLRINGLVHTTKLFLLAWGIALLLLGVASLPVTFFRYLISDQALFIFSFPFPINLGRRWMGLNIFFVLLGLFTLVVACLFFLLRARKKQMNRLWEGIHRAMQAVEKALGKLFYLLAAFFKLTDHYTKEKKQTEDHGEGK